MDSFLKSGKSEDRLAALHQLQMLHTAPESEFDNIVGLANLLCGTPMSAVGFSYSDRLWFKAKIGLKPQFNEISESALLHEGPFENIRTIVIEDIVNDNRVNNKHAFLAEGIKFICCTILQNEIGTRIGYLCVFDKIPRVLTAEQLTGLEMLASQVNALLKLRLQLLKNLENEYKDGESQIKTIFQNAIDAVVVTNEDGAILQWNTKATDIFGWQEEEVFGERFKDLSLHPDPVKKNDPTHNFLYPMGYELGKTIETVAYGKGGSEIETALSITPAVIGDKTYYIYHISDITEQKRAARALDKQKEFYENILNNIPTDIAVFDTNHKYLFLNPTAIKDRDLRKYIIGKDDFEYAAYRNRDIRVAEMRRNKFLQAKELRKEIRWEDTINTSSGATYTSLRRMFPVHDNTGNLTMMIGFGMDITERKEMEIKQSQLLQQLSIQNAQLNDFINIVSHNLRAPLVNIALLSEFIEACEDADERKQLINGLNTVLDSLNSTFNELVESIQIREDIEIKSERLLLSNFLQRTLEGLEPEINKSGAEFEINFEEAPSVNYPPKYLNSILNNLVSNALKYKSPQRSPVVKIATSKKNDKVLLSVADNGLGIDMVKHNKNFFKMGQVFHHHPNAKGFGLYLTKAHIEAMGGKIWVESEPDKGATFFIEFTNQDL